MQQRALSILLRMVNKLKWKTLILAAIAASLSFAAGVYVRMQQIDVPNVDSTPILNARSSDVKSEEELTVKGRLNILLVGEDNVEASRRSDTVALITLDIDNRNVRVLSLPRDTRVPIPGHGQQKLNHAFAYGQEELLRQTIQNYLFVPIHYYVNMNYDNFPKLVDMIGGVDIFVGKAMKYRDRKQNLNIDIPVGKHHMNGETALKYVRFRKDALGDIGRVRRQQQFLKAVIHKIYEPANLANFATLSRQITETLNTDLPPSLTLQLCLFVKKLDKETNRIFFSMLQGHPETIDNLSYWIGDPKYATRFLNATTEELIAMDQESRLMNNPNAVAAVTTAEDYSPDRDGPINNSTNVSLPSPEDIMSIVTDIPEAVSVLNGTGKSGVSHQVAEHLQKMGVDVVYTGNAKHFDYRTTNVIYPEKAGNETIKTAQLLAKLCGVSPTLTRKNALAIHPSVIVGHDYEKLLKRLKDSYISEN